MNVEIKRNVTDLSDCICVTCGGDALEYTSQNAIRCANCGAIYDVFNDMPCLLQYQSSEALSLIEILSNLDEQRAPPTEANYRDWFAMLNDVHDGKPVEEIIDGKSPSLQKFLPHRYRQYSVFKTMSEDIDFTGKKVLDVGAGEGFDTAMIAYEGAVVTAAEFNPLLSDLGKGATDARWIPSSAHALPFADETFDVIVCQAALHHILDVSGAMREFLRVVRTGGVILTVSDSYRVSSSGVDVELRQFNRDPAVLRGVNEGMPRLSDFMDPLREHGDSLEVEIHTSRVHGYPDPEKGRTDYLEPRVWSLTEHGEHLKTTAGGVSFKIKKLKPIEVVRPKVNAGIVRPTDFLGSTTDKAAALALLARFIPPEFCDMDFPGPVGNTKFELLNGWMKREDDEDWRIGYLRARRFLTRAADQTRIAIAAKLPAQDSGPALTKAASISVNGVVVETVDLNSSDWTELTIDASQAPDDASFSVELRLLEKAPDFDANTFLVRRFESAA